MKQAQASALFRSECARIPEHSMHVHARMVTTMYLVKRYGPLVNKHKRRIAVALERMDGAYA